MGSAVPAWQLDHAGFRLYDGTQNDYGAPSGPGVTTELPSGTGNAFFRGIVTASRIQGVQGGATGKGARMWFDFTAGDPSVAPAGATAGISPYWGITDDNGVIRVEAGLLAALGISPSQWGIRVSDGTGKPIFDSMGLIAVMAQPGTAPGNPQFSNGAIHGSSGFSFAAPTYSDVPFSELTVTVPRQSSWLCLADISASTGGAGPGGTSIAIGLDGVAQVGTGSLLQYTQTGLNVNGTLIYAPVLQAGIHTFSIMASGSPALVLTMNTFDIWAFQLGT